jgi:5-methylcytosine-specific restriction endonuclease McrA
MAVRVNKRNGSTWAWRKVRAQVLAASTICHLCGEDGADAVDHVIPLAQGGSNDRSNLRPAHHYVANSRGEHCNMRKGSKLIAPVMRRSSSLNR